MAQFQQVVLDYLESYRPDEYEQLKRERRLRARMDELVEQLYAETDRVLPSVMEQHEGISEEQARVLAEGVAIRTLLPM